MLCGICGKTFPTTIKMDGKKHNLCNRRYCIECSPFKKHNTIKLENRPKDAVCEECGKLLQSNQSKFCSNKCKSLFYDNSYVYQKKEQLVENLLLWLKLAAVVPYVGTRKT